MLEDLLKALLKNGLTISPKKCKLLRNELQYMGNTVIKRDRKVCVKPLRSRLEVIQNYSYLQQLKDVEIFCRSIKYPKYILPGITKTFKAYIYFNKKRLTINMGRRATGGICRNKM